MSKKKPSHVKFKLLAKGHITPGIRILTQTHLTVNHTLSTVPLKIAVIHFVLFCYALSGLTPVSLLRVHNIGWPEVEFRLAMFRQTLLTVLSLSSPITIILLEITQASKNDQQIFQKCFITVRLLLRHRNRIST